MLFRYRLPLNSVMFAFAVLAIVLGVLAANAEVSSQEVSPLANSIVEFRTDDAGNELLGLGLVVEKSTVSIKVLAAHEIGYYSTSMRPLAYQRKSVRVILPHGNRFYQVPLRSDGVKNSGGLELFVLPLIPEAQISEWQLLLPPKLPPGEYKALVPADNHGTVASLTLKELADGRLLIIPPHPRVLAGAPIYVSNSIVGICDRTLVGMANSKDRVDLIAVPSEKAIWYAIGGGVTGPLQNSFILTGSATNHNAIQALAIVHLSKVPPCVWAVGKDGIAGELDVRAPNPQIKLHMLSVASTSKAKQGYRLYRLDCASSDVERLSPLSIQPESSTGAGSLVVVTSDGASLKSTGCVMAPDRTSRTFVLRTTDDSLLPDTGFIFADGALAGLLAGSKEKTLVETTESDWIGAWYVEEQRQEKDHLGNSVRPMDKSRPLDEALLKEEQRLENNTGIKARLYWADMDDAMSLSDGRLIIGLQLYRQITNSVSRDKQLEALRLVLAHEFAHQVQYSIYGTNVDQWTPQEKELQADCFAGVWFFAQNVIDLDGDPAASDRIQSSASSAEELVRRVFRTADVRWNSPESHGSADQRSVAVKNGLYEWINIYNENVVVRQQAKATFKDRHKSAKCYLTCVWDLKDFAGWTRREARLLVAARGLSRDGFIVADDLRGLSGLQGGKVMFPELLDGRIKFRAVSIK